MLRKWSRRFPGNSTRARKDEALGVADPAPTNVLLTAEQIDAAVREMAARISADYRGKPLTLVGVLTGSVVLLADLVRLLSVPCRIEMVRADSYRGPSTEAGQLAIDVDCDAAIRDRHVVLVDDILDTGRTLAALVERLSQARPAGIRTAVLLRKEGRPNGPIEPDYGGVPIPDRFVVGYGLDYDGRHRQLPYIAAID